jgi:hypothetical protein
MNLLKLTLFFCLFTTVLFGQQEMPGYVVLLEGDTLRGRIAITTNKIKFRHDGGKAKYLRSEIADYGYYSNKVFFSRPDEITPAPESDITSTVVLATGDTLHNFYLQNVNPDFIICYSVYPKYVLYEARTGGLKEITIHDEEEEDITMRLFDVEDYPKQGQMLPVYVISVVNEGLKAYNGDRSRPYYTDYSGNKVLGRLIANALPLGIFTVNIAEEITKSLNADDKRRHSQDWIVYKNDKSYTINSAKNWNEAFGLIFQDDKGFPPFLAKRDISLADISGVLEAYDDFIVISKQ